MVRKIYSILWSTKLALVLLVLIFLSCTVGVLLPRPVAKEIIFTSLWFNFLLVILNVNIVFCITKRTRFLRLSQAGTTIFHLGLVVLFVGVVYDQLFFFDGAIRLTEGESLSCSDRASYDQVRTGRFFRMAQLETLGNIYFHKLHTPPFMDQGKERGIANEIAVGEDFQTRRTSMVYVNHTLQYKGFELFRGNKEGYSPLIVLRDRKGEVLHGAYAPLQSIKQNDGTYMYRSGTAASPGSFSLPQDPGLPPVLQLQTVFLPDKIKKRTGKALFQVWGAQSQPGEPSDELFNGKAALGEKVKVGDYFLSMDEVRYWTSMNVVYRPGQGLIFASFWIAFGGLILNLILKTIYPVKRNAVLTSPVSEQRYGTPERLSGGVEGMSGNN